MNRIPNAFSQRTMRSLAFWTTFAIASSGFSQASFTPVGDLVGSQVSSHAFAISGDGRTVVGMSLSTSGREAFRWNAGSISGLGDLPGFNFESYARDVSHDGSVIVGSGSSGADGNVGFRWTASGGMTSLRDLSFGAVLARANSVSGDGLVSVGYGTSAAGRESVYWTSASPTTMGDFVGGVTFAEATAANADGSVIAGTGARGGASGGDAFRWTQAGGFQYLGDLPGGNVVSMAYGISADGNTIVGSSVGTNSFGNNLTTAFRWTPTLGMVGLESLIPNGTSWGQAVSPDGKIIGGRATDAISQDNAAIWTETGAIIDVKEALIGAGLGAQLDGWELTEVTGVANMQNGYAIVCGNATSPNNEAMGWTAYVPVNPVPEPGTVSAVVIGIGALLRRKKRKKSN